MRLSLIAFSATALLLTGCVSDRTKTGSIKAYSASNSAVKICSGYGCVYKDETRFTSAQSKKLAAIMRSGRGSEQGERAAIKRAIAQMEKWTRSRLGFGSDVRRSFQRYVNVRGQMDCVDETRNTTAYLNFMSSRGLLKHHRVAQSYAAKGFILDGNMPHRSAVIISKKGQRFAVDSWPTNNGGKPLIMPVSKWHSTKI